MAITPPFYPIVYVRGYAAVMSEIEETVATPYMGFNLGSTKIRQDYQNKIVRFVFESPLVRLMKDEGYVDTYRDGDYIPLGEKAPAKSIWIFRYYEKVSEDLGEGERSTIPQFALELRRLILRIRDQVCGDDPAERAAFKVYLVAHSMGGLICRTYLQNICGRGVRDGLSEGEVEASLNRELELPGDSLVDKVFTYATPHNGIEVAGMNIPDLGALDGIHMGNFNRGNMRKYLRLPDGSERVDSLNDPQGKKTFDENRFFCFVGTNYRDYDAFFGLSKRGTGPMSDGLVTMRNATVAGAPRAFAHRSHSGHYGIVNSEEGYQNLKRFLFGQIRVDAQLICHEITLPEPLEELKKEGKKIRAAYNIEATAKVRGAGYNLTERRVSQESAIRRTYEKLVESDGRPVNLFSGYLDKRSKTKGSRGTSLAFAVHIAMQVPLYEVDRQFWFDDHFEGGYVFDDTLTFHLRTSTKKTTIRYGLASVAGIGETNHIATPEEQAGGALRIDIPLGFRQGAANPPRPGLRGTLRLTASPWNA
jgi:hypothetical protein